MVEPEPVEPDEPVEVVEPGLDEPVEPVVEPLVLVEVPLGALAAALPVAAIVPSEPVVEELPPVPTVGVVVEGELVPVAAVPLAGGMVVLEPSPVVAPAGSVLSVPLGRAPARARSRGRDVQSRLIGGFRRRLCLLGRCSGRRFRRRCRRRGGAGVAEG